MPDLPLDEARADRALAIFKALRIPDVPGFPTFGQVAAPWTFDLVRAVFGAFDPQTRQRMIREYFVLIPKKNTKTTVAAAILVVAALMNEVPAHTFALIAPTINVAQHAFGQASGIIRRTVLPSGTALDDLFAIRSHKREIELLDSDLPCIIAIKAADTDTVTGFKNGSCLIDELHELAGKANAAALLVEIRGAMAGPQNRGFLMTITTQSKAPPRGAFRNELRRAREVRDGETKLPILPILYELPAEDAVDDGWLSRERWSLVNPNMGRSVDMAFLEDQFRAAESDGPDALQLFASQHLNVEIGQALGGDKWPGALHWEKAGDPKLTLAALLDRSEVCTIGVDWGGADDLAALAVIGRERDTKRWLHWVHAWARPSVFERRKSIASALRDFERDRDLSVVRTAEEQAAQAADVCARVYEAGLLPTEGGIGLDVAGIWMFQDELEARGMVSPLVAAIPQGWKLQAASSTLPLKLEDGRMIHGAQRLMAWAVGNAKQVLRGSNYVVSKEAAGHAKIDPLAATFNAAMAMAANPVAAADGASYLDEDELMVF